MESPSTKESVYLMNKHQYITRTWKSNLIELYHLITYSLVHFLCRFRAAVHSFNMPLIPFWSAWFPPEPTFTDKDLPSLKGKVYSELVCF